MRQTLRLHSDSHCAAATRIEADIARPRTGSLILSYIVSGRISDLRFPPAVAAARADELWRHTCFEAFVRPSTGPAYYEFNFSPSTQWAVYQFDSYRSGMRAATEIGAPRIEVRSSAETYTLQAALEFDGLSSPLHLGLSAVLEETNGGKSHWALAHPPGNADFHHADCFALELS
ncbi:MAG TPA: DOMON-like domain-containing protein [Xanthobacteraceae bacterium]|nr:DOMON-like domain-containing protein [Xanthobacteraceae bacterium]